MFFLFDIVFYNILYLDVSGGTEKCFANRMPMTVMTIFNDIQKRKTKTLLQFEVLCYVPHKKGDLNFRLCLKLRHLIHVRVQKSFLVIGHLVISTFFSKTLKRKSCPGL